MLTLALTATLLAGPLNDATPTTPPALLPEAVSSFGAAWHKDRLYVLGGHVGRAHAHSLENLSQSFVRSSDEDLSAWELLPGAVRLQSVALCSSGDDLIRVGGLSAGNLTAFDPEILRSVREVSRYDEERGRWEALPGLPEPRSSHDAFVHEGKLYVFGGWDLESRGEESMSDWHDHGLVLDLGDPSARWERIQQPFRARACVVTGFGSHLAVIGGIDEGGVRRQVAFFDPSSGSWSDGPELPEPGFGASAVAVGDRLYVAGMHGGLYSLASDEAEWRSEGSLVLPRFFARFVATPEGRIAVVGGATRKGHVAWTEWLEPGAPRLSPGMATASIPFEGRSRQRSALWFEGSELHFAGGNSNVESHKFEPEFFVDEHLSVDLGDGSTDWHRALPVPRQSMASLQADTAGRKRMLLGGFGFGEHWETAFDGALTYDSETGAWVHAEGALPVPRTQFGATRRPDGSIWVFGGVDYDHVREPAFIHPLEVLTRAPEPPGAPFVDTGLRIPRPRRAAGFATLGDRAYCVGGLADDFVSVDEVDVFDFETRTWSTAPSPTRTRITPTLEALDGKLYLAGGRAKTEEGFVSDASIECFDPSTNRWSTLAIECPWRPRGLQSIVWGDRLVLLSLSDTPGELRIAILNPEGLATVSSF